MRPVKTVLFVSLPDSLPWSGGQHLWHSSALALLSKGHRVFFSYKHWDPKPAPLVTLEQRGAHAFYTEPIRKKTMPARVKIRFRRWRLNRARYPHFTTQHWLLSQVMDSAPDIVVVTPSNAYAIKDIDVPLSCLHEQGIPVFIISQIEDDSIVLDTMARSRLRDVYAKCAGCAFGSINGASLLSRQLALRFPNVSVFDNPLNCTGEALPWPDAQMLKMACVGRLDVLSKGQDKLLAVLAEPQWRTRDWHLSLYGVGPDELYLNELLHYFDLKDRVTFAGYCSSVDDIWRNEHVCLQPSPKEGTPMTVVEAMFCGRPCVGANVGRITDLIKGSGAGWLVERSLASLSEGLENTWRNRAHLKALGQKAHDFLNHYWRRDYACLLADLVIQIAQDQKRINLT